MGANLFRFEERVLIERYIKDGKTYSQIGELLGRSTGGIFKEAQRGGARNYSAILGENVSKITVEEKRKKLSEINNGNIMQYKQRIENLEMQVEILTDAIKELMQK